MIINEMSLLSNQVSNVPGTVRPQEVLVDGATESWWSPSVESKSILHSKTACSELTSFPFRLHDMLNDAEGKGFADVICWQGDGRSFKIRDKCRFAKEVLPNYFQGQTHYKSFQRQLNIYGFSRVIGGSRRDMGTYTHQLLVRGEPRMCRFMVRTKIKNKGSRSSSSNNMFINMSHLKQEQHQSVPIPPTVAASESVQKISTDNSITTLPHHILCDRSQNDCCSPKLAPTSSCAISCEQEEILESTKRLQDLEKKNRKILKLLELRLSLLEMKTVETGNYHSYLQSLSHIDASPSVLDCKNDEDAVNNKHEDHAGVWDLTTELICGGGSNVHICDDTLEDMDHDQFDNIFNDSDLKILPAEFSPFHLEPMVPSDTHGMSNHSHSHTFFPTSDRAVFERKSALYPDVAAELVRIFG